MKLLLLKTSKCLHSRTISSNQYRPDAMRRLSWCLGIGTLVCPAILFMFILCVSKIGLFVGSFSMSFYDADLLMRKYSDKNNTFYAFDTSNIWIC